MTLTVEWPMIFAAFLLGLASSIHCIGMCGPLVLMLPFGNTGDGKSLLRFFLYGISKAGVYGMFGLFFGLFGWGIKYASSQMLLSILSGIIILFFAFLPTKNKVNLLPGKINDLIVRAYQKVIGKQTWYYFILAGIFNALLPCAMILVALTAAGSIGSPSASFVFMVFFGIGTLPALAFVSFFKSAFLPRLRYKFQWTSRFFAVALAIVLIFRAIPGSHNHNIHQDSNISTCIVPK